MSDMWDAIDLAHHVRGLLFLARMRKDLADDEHLNPLPIYGSARMYDRVPLAGSLSPSAMACVRRELFNIAVPTTNNEEGS